MNNSTICIDASLVVRLVTDVNQESNIARLWEQWDVNNMSLVAPALLFFEVTNALYRYQHQGWFQLDTVTAMLRAALALPIEMMGDIHLHLRAREAAMEYNLKAAYDAHYLALADHLNCEFWTVDARLIHSLQNFNLQWARLAV